MRKSRIEDLELTADFIDAVLAYGFYAATRGERLRIRKTCAWITKHAHKITKISVDKHNDASV
jgi:hypothetical protein